MSGALDHAASAVWHRSEVVEHYRLQQGLTDVERHVVDHYLLSARRWDILDLGVGAGRTSRELAAVAGRYVGVDVSLEMARACREHRSETAVAVADASNLPARGSSFDLVFFSFNGIDYLDNCGRRKCLQEVRRVLRKNGLFVFSTHNPRAVLAGIEALRSRKALLAVMIRVRRLFLSTSFWRGHGYVLDPAHGGILTHTALARHVRLELSNFGFEVLEVVGADFPEEFEILRTPWQYFVARVRDDGPAADGERQQEPSE